MSPSPRPAIRLIADGQNSAIRRVNRLTGVITTVAGLGVFGDVPPDEPTPVDEVALADPRGVAALPDGSFAIADAGLHAVLLVTPDGLVRTLLKPLRSSNRSTSQCRTTRSSSRVHRGRQGDQGRDRRAPSHGREEPRAPWLVAVESTGRSSSASSGRGRTRARRAASSARAARAASWCACRPAAGSARSSPGRAPPVMPGSCAFRRVSGVAAGPDDSILVADTNTDSISRGTAVREISSGGEVTEVVGGRLYAAQLSLGRPWGSRTPMACWRSPTPAAIRPSAVPLAPAGAVSAIVIDVANPPAGASTRSTANAHLVKGKAHHRRRIPQDPGQFICVRKTFMVPQWAPSFVAQRNDHRGVQRHRDGPYQCATGPTSQGIRDRHTDV